MKKRLAIVLAAAMLAVMSSQAVFADGGKETMPRPEVEAGESAVPEDEPRILTPDRESLEESPDILTPSGSLGKDAGGACRSARRAGLGGAEKTAGGE